MWFSSRTSYVCSFNGMVGALFQKVRIDNSAVLAASKVEADSNVISTFSPIASEIGASSELE